MKLNKRIVGAMVGIGLLVGSLGGAVVLADQPTPAAPPTTAQTASQADTGPNEQVQSPSYSGSTTVDQTQYEGMSEADEAAALQGKATITADQAKAAAEAANPGATAVKVELDNENGVLVYSVELDNGLDVKVDAGNGQILHTEQAGTDQEEGDQDNVQKELQQEQGTRADDASEMAHAEDAPGR